MNKTKLAELQQELDVEKWLQGVANDNDPCGSYAYCVNCDKAEEHPCANAKTKAEKATKKVPATDKAIRLRKTAPQKKTVAAN